MNQYPNVDLTRIARMIDISAVRANSTLDEVERLVYLAKHYRFAAAFSMPCFAETLVQRLNDCPDIAAGGVVGFPSGADTTAAKVACAEFLLKMGCTEIDMVMNIGYLKSGRHRDVFDDVKAVASVAGGHTLKVILEIAHLTRDEIVKACELAVEAGAAYVKTGTGWVGTPVTVEEVRLMKQTVGDAALIKVAGSVRTLDTILEMIEAGCSRFGIGYTAALDIMRQVDHLLGRDAYVVS